MNEQVLVFPARNLLVPFNGLLTTGLAAYLGAVLNPQQLSYRDRQEVENDQAFKQVIPYIVLECQGLYFNYRRSTAGKEERLHEQRSVGIGGHINPNDSERPGQAMTFYENAFLRELKEETGLTITNQSIVRDSIIGLVNDDSTAVGRVHFGIVHLLELPRDHKLEFKDAAVAGGMWCCQNTLLRDIAGYETWSRFVIKDYLNRV
jgi:predicted NUDIX family phosphoesterase